MYMWPAIPMLVLVASFGRMVVQHHVPHGHSNNTLSSTLWPSSSFACSISQRISLFLQLTRCTRKGIKFLSTSRLISARPKIEWDIMQTSRWQNERLMLVSWACSQGSFQPYTICIIAPKKKVKEGKEGRHYHQLDGLKPLVREFFLHCGTLH